MEVPLLVANGGDIGIRLEAFLASLTCLGVLARGLLLIRRRSPARPTGRRLGRRLLRMLFCRRRRISEEVKDLLPSCCA